MMAIGAILGIGGAVLAIYEVSGGNALMILGLFIVFATGISQSNRRTISK